MDTDWQTEILPMKKRNAYLLKTGLRSDCCFLVGLIAEDQRLFQAHKFVLASASPVFERMFYGSLPTKDNEPIQIIDVDADDFNNIVNYMYTEEISFMSVEKAQQLYYAAKKYMLNQLINECIDFLKKNITTENVCQVYEFAKQFDEQNLEAECMKIIKTKTSDVLEFPTLLLANVSTLDTILSQDHLNIQSELELFNALKRYAEFRFSINKRHATNLKNYEIRETTVQLESNKNDTVQAECDNTKNDIFSFRYFNIDILPSCSSKKMEHSKQTDKLPNRSRGLIEDIAHFQNVFKKIRFLTLTAKEFANGPAISNLLSESDALALLVCIVEPQNLKNHFPREFSFSKEKRIPNREPGNLISTLEG